MDELYEKTKELLKSLLSVKTGASKDVMVPAIKPPTLKAPSIKQPSVPKVPSALPPPSKKDPTKVAEQLKNPNPEKVKIEVLKVEGNGQWSLEKGVDSLTPELKISLSDEAVGKIKEHQSGCQVCMMSGPQNCTKRRKLLESHLPK